MRTTEVAAMRIGIKIRPEVELLPINIGLGQENNFLW
jgi:hypothetical protein